MNSTPTPNKREQHQPTKEYPIKRSIPIVPHSNTANGPLPPHIVIISGVDMMRQEVQEFVYTGYTSSIS
jgi:hypothetical protein